MDLKSYLKAAALRLAESLHHFAAFKKWPPEDYRIYMIVNRDWEQFTAELVARAYDHGIRDEDYVEVMHFVKKELTDDPDLYRAFGLVIRPLSGYARPINRRFSTNSVEVDDALLNPELGERRSLPTNTGAMGQ